MTELLLVDNCRAFVNVMAISWFLIGSDDIERIDHGRWRAIRCNVQNGGVLLLGNRVVAANSDRARRSIP